MELFKVVFFIRSNKFSIFINLLNRKRRNVLNNLNLKELKKSSYHYEDPYCLINLEKAIKKLLLENTQYRQRPAHYLCIGTDRATGDCLGPLVGTKLKLLNKNLLVYGCLEQPTHAKNLNEVLDDIYSNNSSPLIVAIDACLGAVDRIGYINVNEGSIKPGTALKKELPDVGDFHISGMVNVGGYFEHLVLQNTRLNVVYKMAEHIAWSIILAHKQVYVNPEQKTSVFKQEVYALSNL